MLQTVPGAMQRQAVGYAIAGTDYLAPRHIRRQSTGRVGQMGLHLPNQLDVAQDGVVAHRTACVDQRGFVQGRGLRVTRGRVTRGQVSILAD